MSELIDEKMNVNTKSNSGGVKRKKKRSANQMAKKFARRRDTSDHGYELDTETYEYMLRILEILRTEFQTMDDKLNFVNNVYEQSVDREIEFAKNQVGSRILDSLMEYASFDVIRRIVHAFSPSLRPLCSDRFASHVIEKLIYVCSDRGNQILNSESMLNNKCKNEIKIEKSFMVEYNDMAIKLCKYVLNNIEEFIYDSYANHILRTAIKCLGGQITKVEFSSNKKPGIISACNTTRSVMQEYTDLLLDVSNRFLKWPQLMEFGKDELTSGFLQALLQSLINVDPKLTSLIIERITKECFTENSNDSLSTIFDCESSIRLLESCLSVATPELFEELHEKYFADHLQQLSQMANTQFSVQRLLDYCSVKEKYEMIFDELSGDLNSILEKQHTGVLVSLVNGCLRLQAKQGPFINAITKCLDCGESNRQSYIVPLIARLITYDQYESAKKGLRKIPIHLHGSMILQATLQFNKPIKIVSSILDMKSEELVALFSDTKGSRILDAFMDSKYVGEKSRDKLAKQLKGYWVELARGVHGSRCVDKVWQHSKDNQKLHIMEELASAGEAFKSSKTGRIMYAKLNVALYTRDKQSWMASIGKEEKTKALFAGIIAGANDK